MEQNEIKETRGSMVSWIKAHKKQLIFAGISITAIIGLILGIKNRQALIKIWNSLQQAIDQKSMVRVSDKIIIEKIELVAPDVSDAKIIAFPAPRRMCSEQFDVSKHIRNLPKGMHPSPEKIATALEHGFELAENQTWVTDYVKASSVA